MARRRSYPSNLILATINFITALLSIPVIVMGIWLIKKHPVDCLSFLQWPVLIIGIIMLVVSLLGLGGSLRRIAFLLWIYMCFLFLILLLLLAFTIFAFAVTRGGKGHAVAGAKFQEYRLNDYSSWLRDRVNLETNWNKIKLCIRESDACNELKMDYATQPDLYGAKISYIQSGCCKPPSSCGFKFVTATSWVDPTNPEGDVDCSRWSNDGNQVCYDCNSCRAGVMRTVKRDWEKVAKVMLAVLIVLALLYGLAWVVFVQALQHQILTGHLR